MSAIPPLPPGTYGLPLVGETLSFARDPFGFFAKRVERHGPVFKTSILGAKVACFAGPEAFDLFVDPQHFTRAGASPKNLQELLSPEAVPFLDGAAHKVRKRLLLQAVGPAAVAGFVPKMQALIDRQLAAVVGHQVTFADTMGDLAFALTDALFAGGDPDHQTPGVRAAFDDFVAGAFAPPIRLPFTPFGKALQARQVLMTYFRQAVARHKTQPQQDVMTGLLNAREDGVALSDEEVAIETLHFFFAAYAGMAALLTDLVLGLAQHPQAREQAEAEVRAFAGQELTTATLRQMTYLDALAREVKRFYPVIPFTFFAKALTDVDVAGVRVPKGWRAMGLTFQTCRDPKAFTDAERFDPGRFQRGEGQGHPPAFVPQGGGAPDGHRCAGEYLSLVLLQLLAARLLAGYTWELPSQDLSLDMTKPPPRPRDGLQLTLRARPLAATLAAAS